MIYFGAISAQGEGGSGVCVFEQRLACMLSVKRCRRSCKVLVPGKLMEDSTNFVLILCVESAPQWREYKDNFTFVMKKYVVITGIGEDGLRGITVGSCIPRCNFGSSCFCFVLAPAAECTFFSLAVLFSLFATCFYCVLYTHTCILT